MGHGGGVESAMSINYQDGPAPSMESDGMESWAGTSTCATLKRKLG